MTETKKKKSLMRRIFLQDLNKGRNEKPDVFVEPIVHQGSAAHIPPPVQPQPATEPQAFCPACGTKNVHMKNFCGTCGNGLVY